MDRASLNEKIAEYSQEFQIERLKRKQMGAQQYGEIKFLEEGVNLIQMMGEELMDFANYAEFLYTRLCLAEEALQNGGFIE